MIEKLLVLAIILAIVWYGYKYVARVDQVRKDKVAQEKRDAARGIADTEQCPVCKTYVAVKGASNCGKPGCPY